MYLRICITYLLKYYTSTNCIISMKTSENQQYVEIAYDIIDMNNVNCFP